MANIKSAKKRAKQTVVRNARNTSQRSMLRTLVKKVVKALETKDVAAAEAAFVEAVPVLDRYSSRGLIHRNKAARHKSRLTAHIRGRKAAGLRLSLAREKAGLGRFFIVHPKPKLRVKHPFWRARQDPPQPQGRRVSGHRRTAGSSA